MSSPVPSAALIRGVRLVPVAAGPLVPARESEGIFDIRIRDGWVEEVGTHLERGGEEEYDGTGQWAMPGLWDHHVHLGQWAQTSRRIDMSGTASPREVVDRVVTAAQGLPPGEPLFGYGHRLGTWSERPTVSALDAVAPDRPVILISGDAHHGWLNTRALDALGLSRRDDVVAEDEWFAAFPRLSDLPGVREQSHATYLDVMREASAKGLTGLIDLEFGTSWKSWPERVAAGMDFMRVRTGFYADSLDEVIDLGLATADPMPGAGDLVQLGPLKIISDGSLNTRTAWCCEPYADAASLEHRRGMPNVSHEELCVLLGRAASAGIESAVHAIGDAAVSQAIQAFADVGARGSIEHAQLIRPEDIPAMARYGIRASVQPVHLWDDRDVSDHCWPHATDRCFMLRSMVEAGVALRLGSDAPVSPLDPWLQIAAAVHRSGDDRAPWHPDQALTVAQALSGSTDGWGTIAEGHPGDVILLDRSPLDVPADTAEAAGLLRVTKPSATFVGGRLVHSR